MSGKWYLGILLGLGGLAAGLHGQPDERALRDQLYRAIAMHSDFCDDLGAPAPAPRKGAVISTSEVVSARARVLGLSNRQLVEVLIRMARDGIREHENERSQDGRMLGSVLYVLGDVAGADALDRVLALARIKPGDKRYDIAQAVICTADRKAPERMMEMMKNLRAADGSDNYLGAMHDLLPRHAASQEKGDRERMEAIHACLLQALQWRDVDQIYVDQILVEYFPDYRTSEARRNLMQAMRADPSETRRAYGEKLRGMLAEPGEDAARK